MRWRGRSADNGLRLGLLLVGVGASGRPRLRAQTRRQCRRCQCGRPRRCRTVRLRQRRNHSARGVAAPQSPRGAAQDTPVATAGSRRRDKQRYRCSKSRAKPPAQSTSCMWVTAAPKAVLSPSCCSTISQGAPRAISSGLCCGLQGPAYDREEYSAWRTLETLSPMHISCMCSPNCRSASRRGDVPDLLPFNFAKRVLESRTALDQTDIAPTADRCRTPDRYLRILGVSS